MTDEQKQEMKEMRLSGNYTLQEVADKYRVTRERIRQLVEIPNLQKHKEKICVVCEEAFVEKTIDRDRCSVNCRPPLKPIPCIDCKKQFMPPSKKSRATNHRCHDCWVIMRKENSRIYNAKYRAKKKLNH